MNFTDYPQLIFTSSTISDGNMSFKRGEHQKALENRQKFLSTQNISLNQIVCMGPVHEATVAKVTKTDSGKGATNGSDSFELDGLITKENNLYLFLLTADCLPIGLYDPKTDAIGLIHAGWQGLEQDILFNAIGSLNKNFSTKSQDIIVQIGPSIGPCCYKGFDQIKQVNDPNWQRFITKENNKYGLDLWGFAENRLIELGIKKENINNPKICTYHSNKYFSNRKYHAENLTNDYRITTILGIKNE